MESLIGSIANLGFPIVVSIYLLTRIEGKLEALTSSINALTQVMTQKKWRDDDIKKHLESYSKIGLCRGISPCSRFKVNPNISGM